MRPVIFVTPELDPESPRRGFVVSHVRALAERSGDALVIAAVARNVPREFPADVVSLAHLPNRAPGRTVSLLEEVLRDAANDLPGAVVVVDTSVDSLAVAASIAREEGLALLWWHAGAPSAAAVARARRYADVMVTALPAPASDHDVVPPLVAGLGVDLDRFTPAPAPPPRPPFRLLATGPIEPASGLRVALRALAIARGHGVDVRLLVAGRSSEPHEVEHRQELGALATDLAVDGAFRIRREALGSELPSLLREVHAVVDASDSAEVNRRSVEAMACGIPVIASGPGTAKLLAGASLPLRFVGNDPHDLAVRILALAQSWAETLTETGADLRSVVEHQHSLRFWTARMLAAIDEVSRRRGKAGPTAALATTTAAEAVPAHAHEPEPNPEVEQNPAAELRRVRGPGALPPAVRWRERPTFRWLMGTLALAASMLAFVLASAGTGRDAGVHVQGRVVARAPSTVSALAPTAPPAPPTTIEILLATAPASTRGVGVATPRSARQATASSNSTTTSHAPSTAPPTAGTDPPTPSTDPTTTTTEPTPSTDPPTTTTESTTSTEPPTSLPAPPDP